MRPALVALRGLNGQPRPSQLRRLYDLRHTAASQVVMAGENLPLLGKLLGHRKHRTTAGYAHVDDR